jgi:hypothetical protein
LSKLPVLRGFGGAPIFANVRSDSRGYERGGRRSVGPVTFAPAIEAKRSERSGPTQTSARVMREIRHLSDKCALQFRGVSDVSESNNRRRAAGEDTGVNSIVPPKEKEATQICHCWGCRTA